MPHMGLLLLFLALFMVCAGMGLIFSIYICLLWYTTLQVAQRGTANKPSPVKGLSSEELRRLPGTADGGTVGAGTECAICLEDVEDGQAARVLPYCMHVFHLTCSDAWLANHPACPVCRANLVVPPVPSPPLLSAV